MVNPGSNLTSRNRFAQMLMAQEQAAPTIQSHTQGLASLLRQGLSGYMQGADIRDRSQAYQTMMQGLQGGGGYAGAEKALMAMPDNEYAQQMLPGIMGQRISREQQLSDLAAQQQHQMNVEKMRRETGLQDAATQALMNSQLRMQEGEANALRQHNLSRAEVGLPPVSGLHGGDQPMGQQAPMSQQGTGMGRAAPQQGMGYAMPMGGQPSTIAGAKAAMSAQETMAKERAKTQAEREKEQFDNTRSLKAFDVGMKELAKAFGGADTGPIVGFMPNITEGRQNLKSSVSSMAPLLKNLFRSSGEGVFTDKDQELLLGMLPDEYTDKNVAQKAINRVYSIVAAKLGMDPSSMDVPVIGGSGGRVVGGNLPPPPPGAKLVGQ